MPSTDRMSGLSSNDFWNEFNLVAGEKNLAALNFVPSPDSVFFFDEIDSTNSFLLARANESDNLDEMNLSMCASETQTQGRGRLGRKFYSPKNTGIYFSFTIVEENQILDPAVYTIASVVGVCRAVEKLCSVSCGIKWVNDVYVAGKKICGILAEGIVDCKKKLLRGCVVGIGINILTSSEFPQDLMSRAGGICDGRIDASVSREKLLANVLAEIYSILANKENVLDEYRNKSIILGTKITVTPVVGDDTTSYEAEAVNVCEDGGLLVRLSDGTEKKLRAGEVSFHAQ